ncbi:MAG TPA: WbqC family protein [Flavobacterium sp.]|nr:WbqC family protein [Flavobacterium sp.]
MKTAIMQPYLFPYIGYFQLIDSVDTFVVYDDVNFIKKGWINRNNILVNGQSHMFTMPLKDASQNKLISEISISESDWNKDLLKTIALAYKKAPYFPEVFVLVESILMSGEINLAKFIANSLRRICSYLEIDTNIVISSEIEKDNSLKAQDKIIEICKKLDAKAYINAIGGMELYDATAFQQQNITLHFLKTQPIIYSQFKNEFIPWLSIIDVMMFNPVSEIKNILAKRELI